MGLTFNKEGMFESKLLPSKYYNNILLQVTPDKVLCVAIYLLENNVDVTYKLFLAPYREQEGVYVVNDPINQFFSEQGKNNQEGFFQKTIGVLATWLAPISNSVQFIKSEEKPKRRRKSKEMREAV